MAQRETGIPDKILIIGGGIGGLAAALALLRQGFAVDVFEKTGVIGDVGAGISLGDTASKGLYSLDLQEALVAASDRPEPSAALHYQTGEVLGGGFKDRAWKAEDLNFTHLIHRADLFSILEKAVLGLAPNCLHLDHSFQGFEQDSGGITAKFSDGSSVQGSALIGADGIRSAVRDQMFGPESPLFTGRVVYRFLVPMEKARPFVNNGRSGLYVAPGKSFLRYAIRKRTLINCVAHTTADSWTGEGWSERCSVKELQSLFPGWHADVLGLAANAPLKDTAKWALYDRDPLDIWIQGRVALLGDAAHPMLPFLGLGSAMAIEDAVVLGRTFSETSEVAKALERYQAARAERAGMMLLESRRQGQLIFEGPGAGGQRTITTHKERMNYDPSTVPLPQLGAA